jgi:hypothetical protein
MSDALPPLPSRRALREMGLTGPIDVPVPQPQSRRERRVLEATGAIPVITPDTLDQHHADSAPVTLVSAPVEVIDKPVAPMTSSVVAPPAERPLTRRELREQLRSPAKDAPPAPVVERPAPVTGQDVDDAIEAPAIPPKPVSREAEEEFSWQTPLEADEGDDVEEPPKTLKPVRPLPPVFGTAPAGRDTPTASSRTVSAATPATNALILPVAPSIDVTGPMGDTGEVIVTGNIPLPRLVAETGVTGALDVDSEDDFIEADSGPYTAPISASMAVSSRSLELAQPMIHKPRIGAVSLALGVSAAILGVTALSLLALALLTDIIPLPF